MASFAEMACRYIELLYSPRIIFFSFHLWMQLASFRLFSRCLYVDTIYASFRTLKILFVI